MSQLAKTLSVQRIQLQEQISKLEGSASQGSASLDSSSQEHVFIVESPPIGEKYHVELIKAFDFLDKWKKKVAECGLLLRFQHVSYLYFDV